MMKLISIVVAASVVVAAMGPAFYAFASLA